MYVTAYSLAMACIWTSVLALIMYAIQKSKRTLRYFGINNMLILYGFCVFRMVIPIELPITKEIPVEEVYNAVTQLCMRVIIGETFHVGDVFLVIWGCGTVIKLFLLIKDYQMTRRMLGRLTVQSKSAAQELLERLQEGKKDKRKIPVYTSPFSVPMETGILHPAILLPDREYSTQDLAYIIRHEYTHILNHDTTVKLLLNLWTCIFWWNPISYLLNRNIENTLELKCDLTAAGELGENEKAQYLSAILHDIQNVEKEKEQKRLPKNVSALYSTYSREFIVKRFRCVSECIGMTKRARVKYGIYTVSVLIACLTIYGISYSVVFQSNFEAPMEEMQEGEGIIHVLDPETTFLRKTEEGRYEVICENQCITVVEEAAALWMQEQGFEIR